MEIKVEVQDESGKKTTTLTLDTKPTEEAINKASEAFKSWLRKTFTKTTQEHPV